MIQIRAIAQIGGIKCGESQYQKAMAAKSISIEAMADVLHMHRNSVANKINGKSSFSVDEAFKLRDTLFMNTILITYFPGKYGSYRRE